MNSLKKRVTMEFSNDSLQHEKDIKNNNFLTYRDYCEIKLMGSGKNDESFCYRCNKYRSPLTYLEPDFYYLPCWNCASKRLSEREAITEGIIKNIKEFYSRIIGDRYLQLFLVDDIYYSSTLPHEYTVFKKVVNLLDPPSRNDIWFLDWNPGYPKVISLENLEGIKIVNLSSRYNDIELGKTEARVGKYKIVFPESATFDIRHHTRYSILNKKGDRKSKRLKLGDKCIKFFNTEQDDVKSIFKIKREDSDIAIRSLTYQDFVILKLALMRDKTFMRLLSDVINELLKSVGTFRDSVFLKNTVVIDPKKELTLNLVWTPLSEYVVHDNKTINISLV